MPAGPYLALLAATNMKQRIRKLIEYTWADRLAYAVVGTPNLLEYDQGFFVKGGDGLADVKPIAGPLQGPGLRAGRRARAAGVDPLADAHDRDLLAAPDPGGVLLRPSLRAHGPARLGTGGGDRRRRSSAMRPACRRPRSRRPTRRSSGAASPPSTCTRRPRSCTPALTCAASPASSAPSPSTPVEEQALLRMAARDPPSRSRRLRPRASTTAPGWSRPGSRSSTSPAAGSRSSDAGRRRCSSTTARSTTTPSCAPSCEPRASTFETHSDTEVVHAAARARRARRRCDGLNGQFAFAWWQPGPRRLTLVRDRFGVRPLHYRARERRRRSSSARRRRRCSPRARSSAAPDLGGIDEVFTLWGAAVAADARSPASPASSRAGCWSGSAGGSSQQRRWWCRGPARSARRRAPGSRSCCATASASGCAPTCRSAPTSRAGSTRA